MYDLIHSLVANRPFVRPDHMVRNKLCWDANNAVGLSKQRKVGLDWYEFLSFGTTTLFACQHNLFRTINDFSSLKLLIKWEILQSVDH